VSQARRIHVFNVLPRSKEEEGDLLLRSNLNEHQMMRKLHSIYSFYLYSCYFLLSAILLNCCYPDPRVFPFLLMLLPIPLGEQEWESDHVVLCCQLELNHTIHLQLSLHNDWIEILVLVATVKYIVSLAALNLNSDTYQNSLPANTFNVLHMTHIGTILIYSY